MKDSPVFDIEQLLNYTGDDRDLAAQVVALFLREMPDQLSQLDRALDAGDVATAERLAHSIKGAAATVGGGALSRIAFDCERLGHEGHLDQFRERMADFHRQYDLLSTALQAVGFETGDE